MIFNLAWRNIWRNPKRTSLTLFASAFATAVMVFFVALQHSSYDTSIATTLRLGAGHLQVQAEGYQDTPRLQWVVTGSSELEAQLQSIPGIVAVTSRVEAFGLLASEQRTFGVQLLGVDPDKEAKLFSIAQVVRRGSWLVNEKLSEGDVNSRIWDSGARVSGERSSPAVGVVIGKLLAENLQVDLGQELAVLGQAYDGSVVADVLIVQGIFDSGVKDLDRSVAYLRKSDLQEMFALGDGVHRVVIWSGNFADARGLAKVIATKVRKDLNGSYCLKDGRECDLSVISWQALVPGIERAIELDKTSAWLFYCSLVLIVGLSVLNSYLMVILERTGEFGLMLALGMNQRRVFSFVFAESVILSSLGAILGIVLGVLVVGYFNRYGFEIPGADEIAARWNMPSVVFPRVSSAALLQGPLLVFSVSLLASLLPLGRLLVMNPVQALRSLHG